MRPEPGDLVKAALFDGPLQLNLNGSGVTVWNGSACLTSSKKAGKLTGVGVVIARYNDPTELRRELDQVIILFEGRVCYTFIDFVQVVE